MIAPDKIAAARAVSLAKLVAAEIPLNRQGFGLCPFHTEKSPSFHVNAAAGYFHCFGCGAHGTAVDWVMRRQHLDFPAAVRELVDGRDEPTGTGRRVSSQTARPRATPDPSAGHSFSSDDESRIAAARAVWRAAGPVQPSTAAWLYLHQRGISRSIPPSLRAHPDLYCAETGDRYPALIAAFQDSGRRICAVQRIWTLPRIEYRGDAADPADNRAPLETRKKCLGPLVDAAVRLAPAGRVLGLAEGVETALSAMRLYHVPVWATCGTARLGAPGERGAADRPPSVWIPPEVEELVIFGDNGGPGHRAADFAADWWSRAGLPTQAVYPEERFDDFNSMLMGDGK